MSPRKAILRLCVILLMASPLLGAGPRRAFSGVIGPGGVITVDSFADIDDNAPNSVCSAGDPTDGPCTLRAAIYEANQNVPYQNIIIKLPAGEYNLTIPPNYLNDNDTHSGDLNLDFPGSSITNTVTIEPLSGGPVVVRSLIEDRVLSINIHAKVILNNLTLRDGNVLQDTNNPNKGGGAIYSSGNLTLNGVNMLANTVSCRNGDSCAGTGGAIENWSTLNIRNSTLDGNAALQGGAIWNYGTLAITYSTLSNNHTSNSGNITNYSALNIINSTFSGNSSSSTVSGIYNWGTLSMQSTTMANIGIINAIYNFAGAGKTAFLKDNIFKAESGQSNCYIQASSTWTSGGYNIANDNSCQLTAPGDLSSADPQLGSFDYWGGSTKTIMLNLGSPAINHRQDKCWFSSNFLIDDQRHRLRDDGNCDTGAFEYHVLTEVGATKVWMPSNLPESLKVDVSFQLFRTTSLYPLPQAVDGPVAVTSGSGWKATWTNLPVVDIQGNPCTYFVREVNKPIGFIAEDVDDLTVTNTYALLFLPMISK